MVSGVGSGDARIKPKMSPPQAQVLTAWPLVGSAILEGSGSFRR